MASFPYSTGHLVTASEFNAIGTRLDALESASDNYVYDSHSQVSTYSINSPTMVDIDATNLAVTITTAGGDIYVEFSGAVLSCPSAVSGDLDIFDVSNNAVMGLEVRYNSSGVYYGPVYLRGYVTGLSAGSHTFRLRWKRGGASAISMLTNDNPIQMLAFEVA